MHACIRNVLCITNASMRVWTGYAMSYALLVPSRLGQAHVHAMSCALQTHTCAWGGFLKAHVHAMSYALQTHVAMRCLKKHMCMQCLMSYALQTHVLVRCMHISTCACNVLCIANTFA